MTDKFPEACRICRHIPKASRSQCQGEKVGKAGRKEGLTAMMLTTSSSCGEQGMWGSSENLASHSFLLEMALERKLYFSFPNMAQRVLGLCRKPKPNSSADSGASNIHFPLMPHPDHGL